MAKLDDTNLEKPHHGAPVDHETGTVDHAAQKPPIALSDEGCKWAAIRANQAKSKS